MNVAVIANRVFGIVGRLSAVDRSVFLFYGGAALLGACALLDWYSVPSSSVSYIDAGNGLKLIEDPSVFDALLRVLAFMLGLFLVIGGMHRAAHRRAIRTMLWMALLLILFFPYYINQWEPDRLFDSRIVYLRMDRVVKNMEFNFNQQQSAWREDEFFNPLLISNLGATEIPADDGWEMTLLSPVRLVHAMQTIFGISNPSLELVGAGWVLSLCALTVILMAAYLRSGNGGAHLRADLRRVIPLMMGICLLLLGPRLIGEYHVQEGKQAYAEGNYTQALAHWRTAYVWKPVLRVSTEHIANIGGVVRLKGCNTCLEALLADAYDSLQSGRLEAAKATLLRAQPLYPDYREYRIWFNAVYAESGIRAFNDGRYSVAEEDFRAALAFAANDALSWYGLMLVKIKYKDFAAASAYAQRIADLQSYIRFKSLTVRAQVFLTKSWALFLAGDDTGAHELYRRWLSPETW